MKHFLIIVMLLIIAGCNTSNPVSPISDTIQSHNLQVTFSAPESSYGVHDTLVAATTAYNPGDTTVSFYVPNCWPTIWYSVQDSSGATKLSYAAPRYLDCASVTGYSIPPHQSLKIFQLRIVVPIAELDTTKAPQGPYVLAVDNYFGTFSLKFAVK